MKRIAFKEIKVETQKTTEWADLLDQTLKRINPGRIEAGYKPLTHAGLARKLSQAGYRDTTALRDLYKECSKAKSFGKLLWHLLANPKP